MLLRRILFVKAVPSVSWSAHHPLILKPKFSTLAALFSGLTIFGVGEAMLIAAGAGVSPWTVLAQGIALVTGLSIGWATFFVSLVVLLSWIPLKQIPGIGTVANVVIVAIAIGMSLYYLPTPESFFFKILQSVFGILMVGLGSGFYLIANLGAGPRDGLMTGLQRITNSPIAWVRALIEIIVVVCGWILGGSVGLGTIMFALGIGPAVSIGLFTVNHFSPEANEL
ncbi:MAG: hypothetical protein CMQ41_03805 [Gammaproteobacteria bacterium]|nr:hypothetical protein [Gammaproteobacteria bacterium]